jgi:hypothetical protein
VAGKNNSKLNKRLMGSFKVVLDDLWLKGKNNSNLNKRLMGSFKVVLDDLRLKRNLPEWTTIHMVKWAR